MPTVLCPGCARAIDLPPEEFVFAAIDCARCGTTFTPAEHLAPEAIPVPVAVPIPAPSEPAVQCFDCGRAVPMSAVVRRDVVTGGAETSGRRGEHYYTDTTTHTGRVSLCRRCAAERDRQAAAAARSAAIAMFVTVVVFLVLGAGAGVLFLRDYQAQQEQQARAEANAKAQGDAAAAQHRADQEVGERAQREQQEQADPEARQRAEKEALLQAEQQRVARLEKVAQARLLEIKRLQIGGNPSTEVIRAKFNALINDCAGTPTAKEAEELFQTFLEDKAKRQVDYAKKLIAAGETPKKDLRDRLDKIIKDFAGTPSAEEAKRLRKELGKE